MEEAFGTVKLLLLWPIMAKEEEGAVLLLGPHLVSPSASEPRGWDQALNTTGFGELSRQTATPTCSRRDAGMVEETPFLTSLLLSTSHF